MSTKSLKTQLLAAVAMVLVAAVALGNSTFAWFAMNSTVTANNVKISASSAKPYLQIADGEFTNNDTDKTHFSTALNWTDNVANLGLAAPSQLGYEATPAANKWYEEVSNDADTAIIADDTDDGHTALSAFTNYVVVKTITLKNSSNITAENLTVSFDITDETQAVLADNNIENAFRVLVVAEGNEKKYVAFKADGAAVDVAAGLTGNNAVTVSDGYTYASAGVLDTAMAQDEVVHANIFIYFDGNDADAISANELLGEKIIAGLKFTVTDPDASSSNSD